MAGVLYMHKQFCRAVHRLTSDEQMSVKDTLSEYLTNPRIPGLHWHRLDKCKDQDFASIRSSRDIRIILHPCLDGEVVCYVDHHDDAYHWAEQRFLRFDVETKDVEIYTWPVGQECPFVAPCRPERRQPLFASLSDGDLRYYGVPAEWLPVVRKVTSADEILDELVGRLPDAVSENLLSLSEGRRPARRECARDYVKIGSVDELGRALDMSWDEWSVYLHPEQRKIVDWNGLGDLVVTGGPGTGKTVVALHRAARLSREGCKVLLVATSPALIARLRRQIQLLPHTARAVELLSFEELCRRLGGEDDCSILSRADLDGLLLEAADEVFDDEVYALDQLRSEFLMFRDECCLSREEYLTVDRHNRGFGLSRSARIRMYRFFDRVSELLYEIDGRTSSAFVRSVLAKNHPNDYSEILVDECQNLTAAEWGLVKALKEQSRFDGVRLSLFGDEDQRVFGDRMLIAGERFELTDNFRSSRNIDDRAARVLGERSRTSCSVYSGCPPVLRQFSSREQETAFVAERLVDLLAKNETLHPSDCAVFVHDQNLLPRAEEMMERAKVPYVCFYDGAELGEGYVDGVTIATFNQAPGLEYRVVFVVGCEDGVVPPYDLEDRSGERRSLYVVMTRARDVLVLTGVGVLSEFLTAEQVSFEARRSAPVNLLPVRIERPRAASHDVRLKESEQTEPRLAIPQRPKASEMAAEYISALYHMTAFENLNSLFEHGLLSKHEAERESLKRADISNDDVQRRRECKCDTRYGRNLHDYASLYVNPRNAMLYYVQRHSPSVCLLEVDLAVLDETSFVFTDANAAAGIARFFTDVSDLKRLNLTVVFASRWDGKGSSFKQQMQAEFLVHPKVQPTHIRSVICRTTVDCEKVRNLVPKSVKVLCDATRFF